MTEQGRPLFGARLPFLQYLSGERQYAFTRAHDGLYHWLGHYQQMMVLEAGIAGVVVPLLYAQGETLIAPFYLRRAVLWFGLSLVIGVIIVAVSKWVMVVIMRMIQQHIVAQDAALGAAEDDEATISAALRQANQAFEPRARVMMRLAWSGIIGDVLFYGCFLAGLWYLARGFVA